MGMRINNKWQDDREADIAEFISSGKHFEVKSEYNPATQWLILKLVNKNIPFRLIQLGAGLKMVTTKTDVCLKCHGTGKC